MEALKVRLDYEFIGDPAGEGVQLAFDCLNRLISEDPVTVAETATLLADDQPILDKQRAVARRLEHVHTVSNNGDRLGFFPREAGWPEVFADSRHREAAGEIHHLRVKIARLEQRLGATEEPIGSDEHVRERARKELTEGRLALVDRQHRRTMAALGVLAAMHARSTVSSARAA